MSETLTGTDEGILTAAARRLRSARHVLVLTGAGVSAESGVPTFRGPQGLWRTFRPEELATPQAFARDARLVWEWYDWRRQQVGAASPNAGHHALARLQDRTELVLATQNVDGLHAEAGSRHVLELHGSLWRTRCVACKAVREDRRVPLSPLPPRCACGGLLRPDVVWFGEPLPDEPWRAAFDAARRAEVVLVVGTSAVVYPAAALPGLAPSAYIIEINPEETPLTPRASVSLRQPAAAVLPALIET